MRRGLVIGKFYPPHRGHRLLIETALAQADVVTVVVVDKPGERPDAGLRARWLSEIHPHADVRTMPQPDLADDDSPGWAAATMRWLGGRPDVVFTSEDYGPRFAAAMGSAHVMVDRLRTRVPISARIVRSDPAAAWEYLDPSVRAYFARRVCVVGAESTGTTTLARDLASHYRTSWVPEYGRAYYEGRQTAGDVSHWEHSEFRHIAETQQSMEDALARTSGPLLICDTDAFATRLWEERYTGSISAEVDALARSRRYALYLLTNIDIPFVQDGTREGTDIRARMHARFVAELDGWGTRWALVSGSPEARLASATALIDALPRASQP